VAVYDGGESETGTALALQTDGKTLVAGNIDIGTDVDLVLLRFNTDGSLDTTFDTDGVAVYDSGSGKDFGWAVALQADCKALVTGGTGTAPNYDIVLLRFNTDGSLDTTFDADGVAVYNGGLTEHALGVTVQGDGKAIVAGSAFNSTNSYLVVLRFHTDGSLDTTFDTDGVAVYDSGHGTDYGRAVVLQADGKALVAGQGYNGWDSYLMLLRFNTDGSLDTTFDADGVAVYDSGPGTESGWAVALQADGKPVVTGYSSNGMDNDLVLVRFNTDGSLDTTFGTNGVAVYDGGSSDLARAIAIQTDGKALVTGSAFNGTDSDLVVLRFHTDGSLDTTFGTNGVVVTDGGWADRGYGVALQTDGMALVAGDSGNGANQDIVLMRFK
jgi:uncharacterized delta-60 repeat protein